ncbi:hypothetical protein ITI46_21445 [Streptomyces oryzae]|uniref:Secreted protein n=1 Tax=Streptomyces oryzae TaxID=1434886 RepID=A0ABS3XFN7_9ACTN|nr:hypothetical protein [Streptomyces oryzae]MBO8194205.1 hypothetical protein [Streptomyces oryzae]
MRSQESNTRSRRGSRIAASAALVCLGAPLAAGCGGGGDDGYVAVGAADPSGRSSDGPVRPDDKVRMVPLPGEGDGPEKSDGGHRARAGDDDTKGARGSEGAGAERTKHGKGADDGGDAGGTGPSGSASTGSPGSPGASGSTGPDGSSPGPGTGGHGDGGGQQTGDGSSGPGSPDSPGSPSGPALLTVSEPAREKTDDRWCEKVTVRFVNSGGRAVTGGKVTFGTHIIGALGVDWATRESRRALPVPIKAGEKKEKTWTVCVDAWRVPLGMHIETRDVRLSGWK